MKRNNFIFNIGDSADVDSNMNVLAEENEDPDIWLGILEKETVIESYKKRNEFNVENIKRINESNTRTTSNRISSSVTKVVMPVVTTVVVASLGIIPGMNDINKLNILNSWQNNNNASITSNIDESTSTDLVFSCRVLDGTQTYEIDNFAVTRKDNSPKVKSNAIAPGTSGEFMIEIDVTRNGSSASV